MKQTISKVVIPVAGLGTRFLPATKTIPKEMLPVVDKPLIQYAIEEAIEAGIHEFIFITHPEKKAIENYFKQSESLEKALREKNKKELLEQISFFSSPEYSFRFINQDEPKGLGHAILCAKEVVGAEPFAVILPDDLINHNPGCLAQMVEIFQQHNSSNIAVENIPANETDKYGIVSTEKDNLVAMKITGIVEKPSPKVAPTTLAVVGRYILIPEIFALLENTPRGSGGEIQLTDAIAMLIKESSVLAYPFKGIRYDCGSKLGYLKANIEYGLQNKEIKKEFSDYINKLTVN